MSTSTWNPERTFPWLGDTLPCPSEAEEQYADRGGSSYLCCCDRRPHATYCDRHGLRFPEDLAENERVAAEDRAATVRLYGEEHVAELEQEANRG